MDEDLTRREFIETTALATSLAKPTSLPPTDSSNRSILRAVAASHFLSTNPPLSSGILLLRW